MENIFLYLDPGSGSIVFQALLGVLIGLGIGVKMYWEKLKLKFETILARK